MKENSLFLKSSIDFWFECKHWDQTDLVSHPVLPFTKCVTLVSHTIKKNETNIVPPSWSYKCKDMDRMLNIVPGIMISTVHQYFWLSFWVPDGIVPFQFKVRYDCVTCFDPWNVSRNNVSLLSRSFKRQCAINHIPLALLGESVEYKS